MRARDLRKKARDDLLKAAVQWWFGNRGAGVTEGLQLAVVSYLESVTPEEKRRLLSVEEGEAK